LELTGARVSVALPVYRRRRYLRYNDVEAELFTAGAVYLLPEE
jgi:hypothetical protein